MDLKALARKVELFDGVVTLYFLPFETPATLDQLTAIKKALKLKDKGDWQPYQGVFVHLERMLVDAEFAASDNAHVQALAHWWAARNGDPVHNWEVFQSGMSIPMAEELWAAYQSSLVELPQPPGLLAEPPPDQTTEKKDSASGGKKSTT
jgi:hypothetical protein